MVRLAVRQDGVMGDPVHGSAFSGGSKAGLDATRSIIQERFHGGFAGASCQPTFSTPAWQGSGDTTQLTEISRLPRVTGERTGHMIVVTRLNKSSFAINPDLIERIQENPDTVVVMVNGATYVVKETMKEVIGLVMHYRASVVSLASGQQPPAPSSAPASLR